MSAGIALLVRHPGEYCPDNADRLPFGIGKHHAGIVCVTGQDLLTFCCVAVSVDQPGNPRGWASVSSKPSLDPVPLGVSHEGVLHRASADAGRYDRVPCRRTG